MPDRPPLPEKIYAIVVNGAGQHSLSPTDRPVPDGWTSIGWEGTHAAALAQMAKMWEDTAAETEARKTAEQQRLAAEATASAEAEAELARVRAQRLEEMIRRGPRGREPRRR